jgi:hypothetical protein
MLYIYIYFSKNTDIQTVKSWEHGLPCSQAKSDSETDSEIKDTEYSLTWIIGWLLTMICGKVKQIIKDNCNGRQVYNLNASIRAQRSVDWPLVMKSRSAEVHLADSEVNRSSGIGATASLIPRTNSSDKPLLEQPQGEIILRRLPLWTIRTMSGNTRFG